MLHKIKSLISRIKALPILAVRLDRSETGTRLFQNFTKRHPRFFLIRQKTIGVGLVELGVFENSTAYTGSVNGKNSAAYFTRKALRAGYSFKEIQPHDQSQAIHEINVSATDRQGRKMDASYTEKQPDYPIDSHNAYFGVFFNDTLVAYLWVVKSGELAVLNRLLGHSEHLSNGIMYLLITAYIEREISLDSGIRFVMYDTIFGASEGLQLFKSRCGFKPYKVKWLQE